MSKNITTDMTQGSPIKHILKFTLPLLVGNLFQQLYNMVDSVVVGQYVGKNELAAVGSCSSTNFLFFSLSSGLGMGIGVIVAQYFGAKDYKNVRRTIANAFYVLIFVALLVSAAGFAVSPWLLKLLDTPIKIYDDTLIYLRTTCVGIVGVALYNGIAYMLRALGDSKTPLVFLIVSSVINVVLDLVFVLCCDLEVFGVALATIIAQVVSAVACLIYARCRIEYFKIEKSEMKPDWKIIGKSFRLGIPLALQSSLIAISCMVLQGVANGFGENVIAAYTITNRIESIVQQPYGSLNAAITTFAGQNAGAGKSDRIKKGFNQTVVVVLIFSLILIPVFYLFGRQIAGFFVSDPEVIEIAYNALKITSLFYFALGMIYVPRGLLNGCGDVAFAMMNGVTEVGGRVIFSQLLLLVPALGYWAVWLTNGLTWTATGLVCLIRYWTGNWKKRIQSSSL